MHASRRNLLAALICLAGIEGLRATERKGIEPRVAQLGPVQKETPEALIRRLYETHAPLPEQWQASLNINPARAPDLLTTQLAALWRKAISRSPNGQALPKGLNPFTVGSDARVDDLSLSVEEQRADAATVLARFTQGGRPGRVAFTLRPGMRGWSVDDVVGIIEGKRWSLRRALSGRKQ